MGSAELGRDEQLLHRRGPGNADQAGDRVRPVRAESSAARALGADFGSREAKRIAANKRESTQINLQMFHVVLECEGIPAAVGSQGALDITEEFVHRPWHQNVTCTWDGRILRLEADNDYDENGLALLDEFSDAICACIGEAGEGDLRVVAVTTS